MAEPTYSTSSKGLQSVKKSMNFKFRAIEETSIDELDKLTQEKFNFLLQILKHFWSDMCF